MGCQRGASGGAPGGSETQEDQRGGALGAPAGVDAPAVEGRAEADEDEDGRDDGLEVLGVGLRESGVDVLTRTSGVLKLMLSKRMSRLARKPMEMRLRTRATARLGMSLGMLRVVMLAIVVVGFLVFGIRAVVR